MVQPIERLGKAGQIVNVAPGYARNRLIPNMLALPAIDKFVIMVQNQIKVSFAWSVSCRMSLF
jgi:large subunit ribosomal protein L9